MTLSKWWRAAWQLVIPPCCLACGQVLGSAEHDLCSQCVTDLVPLPTMLCDRCAGPLPCAPCPAQAAAFSGAWAPFSYDGTARALVGQLKYRGIFTVADLMAKQMANWLPAALMDVNQLVPVPADQQRARKRGFNQAKLLAQKFAALGYGTVNDCLRRTGASTRQVGADRSQRQSTAHSITHVGPTPPAQVVLLDDVHTTGATLDACAQVLRRAGVKRVMALTYARTLP